MGKVLREPKPGSDGMTQGPGALSFPEPVHFAFERPGADLPQLTGTMASDTTPTGLWAGGGGEGSGGRGDGNPVADIQSLPPPYQAAVGTSEDGRAAQAAASGP